MVEYSTHHAPNFVHGPTTWEYATSFGLVPGHRAVQIQGANFDVDTGTVPEAITPLGGLFSWQPSASAHQVVSTSADDSAAGLGVRTILVYGLGNAHEELQEVVTMNGLTPVACVNQYRRVLNCTALTVGAGVSGTNVGEITVRTTAGAIPQAIMPAGFGRNQCAIYTVPAGYQFWVLDGFASIFDVLNSQSFATFQFLARDSAAQPWVSRFFFTVNSGTPTYNIKPPILRALPAGADMTIRVTNAGVNNMIVSATLNGILTQV